MPYRVLRASSTTGQIDPGAAIAEATDGLSALVESAEAEGWQATGGVQVVPVSKPHGLFVYAVQSVRKATAKPAEVPAPVVDRTRANKESR